MEKNNVKKIIFSSSATVYGNSISPLNENSQVGLGISCPYGKTKYLMETILDDLDDSWNIVSLRYFNPVSAHPSGLLLENPKDIPNNLMPFIIKTAVHNNLTCIDEKYNVLQIYGSNYNTRDGTCIRDFIHVSDLSDGHVKAVSKIELFKKEKINLGTGNGTTVLELVNAFSKVNNVKLPYKFVDRRNGDQECVYCTNDKANEILKWYPTKTLDDICRDSWNSVINYNW